MAGNSRPVNAGYPINVGSLLNIESHFKINAEGIYFKSYGNMYRVRLKKMTQHQKCDYSVTHDNFCAKFCALVGQGPVH